MEVIVLGYYLDFHYMHIIHLSILLILMPGLIGNIIRGVDLETMVLETVTVIVCYFSSCMISCASVTPTEVQV